jgi:hypothetical protein
VGDRWDGTSESSQLEPILYMGIKEEEDDSSTSSILMRFVYSLAALFFSSMALLISASLSILDI